MLKFDRMVLLLVLMIGFIPEMHAAGWQKIEVPDNALTVMDDDGNYKDIKPGCAFSYLPDEAGLPNKPFHFYYRKGTKPQTIIYLNGGGACWNNATCQTPLDFAGTDLRPAFNPSIDIENDPGEAGGILDLTRSENPFKDWNMVFIPYCTGDVHIGSKDTDYSGIKVQHRGFDNFMAVREWLKTRPDRTSTEQVLVAGSSAGAYGAIFNFSRIHSIYPSTTKISLLSDGGVGVITDKFQHAVFRAPNSQGTESSPWGTEKTLATWIPGIKNINSYNALNFFTSLATGIEHHFTKSKFAHVTTAWDSVQMLFLNIMRKTDQGVNDPAQWFNVTPVTAVEWNLRMLATLNANALLNGNAKYYIGAGTNHVELLDAFTANIFYTEKSAGGVYLKDWVNRLVSSNTPPLVNLMCSGTCGAPLPPSMALK